eukprot:1161466-Pelagomonas_calceolata.AAC.5
MAPNKTKVYSYDVGGDDAEFVVHPRGRIHRPWGAETTQILRYTRILIHRWDAGRMLAPDWQGSAPKYGCMAMISSSCLADYVASKEMQPMCG